MQFLRTLFWVILAVVCTLFGYNNWTPVTVNLWSDIVVDSWLSLVMAACFLLGLVPAIIAGQAARWRLKRQLHLAERSAALNETAHSAPLPPPAVTPAGSFAALDLATSSPAPTFSGHLPSEGTPST